MYPSWYIHTHTHIYTYTQTYMEQYYLLASSLVLKCGTFAFIQVFLRLVILTAIICLCF